MQISASAQHVLSLVFTLSSGSGALSRPRLERRLGVSSVELNERLEELGRHGLIDAQRLRLTLWGLAVAAAMGGQRAARRPRRTAKSAPKSPLATIALFSRREAPRAVA